jgi:hypothetical protein
MRGYVHVLKFQCFFGSFWCVKRVSIKTVPRSFQHYLCGAKMNVILAAIFLRVCYAITIRENGKVVKCIQNVVDTRRK